MFLHIIEAIPVGDYRVDVTFNNGKRGVTDLAEVVQCGMFTQLSDPEEFARLHVDSELETIVWPNGADLAPEYVYFQAFKNDVTLTDQFRAWGYKK
ncbi:MAG: DUF2442 domain-containing protein [Pseudomonadota bacterium]